MFFFQMKMADTAFENGRDDEYVKYVLYIRPDDVNCDSVIRTVNQMHMDPHIFVIDITSAGSRPPWLRGVPTLLSQANRQTVTGTHNIITFLHKARDDELDMVGKNNMSAPGSASLGGCDLMSLGMFSIDQEDTRPTETRRGGERSQRRAQNAANTDDATQQFMNARTSMDQRVQSTHGGTTPNPRNMMMEQQEPSTPTHRRVAW